MRASDRDSLSLGSFTAQELRDFAEWAAAHSHMAGGVCYLDMPREIEEYIGQNPNIWPTTFFLDTTDLDPDFIMLVKLTWARAT